jgi:poly(3-hydroxyalkanoate) synthetase
VPEAAVLIAATQDQYVPRDSVSYIHALWQGSTKWHIDGGHVTSFVFADPVYRSAIRHAFTKLPE